MLSIKVIFVSTTVLSTAVMLKFLVPPIMEFALSHVPSIWSFIISWLKPPYLYVVINCIIITIVASSRLQSSKVEEDSISPPEPATVLPVNARVSNDASEEMNSVNDFAISKSTWTTLNKDPIDFSFSTEKPPVSARFGHRKSVKSVPEGGRTLGVSKPKRQDTLESTWKTITEGRSMPLTRHLRKSDTWETHTRHHNSHHDPKVSKSETFNSSTSHRNSSTPPLSRSSGSGKLRKEPSLSQDELNKRVQAFIKKFKEDMRLQRQESLNQYMEMINRGAH